MDVYVRYADDAGVLARIGQVLVSQDTRLSVRLPRDLADLAVAAWQRTETGPETAETAAQRAVRHRAAVLALIGLCIENTGQPDGDEIICDLDAWYIGGALDAAEELELLANPH